MKPRWTAFSVALVAAGALLEPMPARAAMPNRAGQRLPGGPSKERDTPIRLNDLNDRLVEPFQHTPGTRAIVFLFVRTDCPASNRYTEDLRRLYGEFAGEGVRFWLVYPHAESLSAVRAHAEGFQQPFNALRDPDHLMVNRVSVLVTPEAAVFDPGGRLLYHGRIDDRYVAYGIERPTPIRQDLRDALVAVLAGHRIRHAAVKAIGCLLSDVAE